VFEEVEGDFEGGWEQEDATYFDGESPDLLSLLYEFILEEVADDGEEGDACIFCLLPDLYTK